MQTLDATIKRCPIQNGGKQNAIALNMQRLYLCLFKCEDCAKVVLLNYKITISR